VLESACPGYDKVVSFQCSIASVHGVLSQTAAILSPTWRSVHKFYKVLPFHVFMWLCSTRSVDYVYCHCVTTLFPRFNPTLPNMFLYSVVFIFLYLLPKLCALQ
jgi:hypothetical protein